MKKIEFEYTLLWIKSNVFIYFSFESFFFSSPPKLSTLFYDVRSGKRENDSAAAAYRRVTQLKGNIRESRGLEYHKNVPDLPPVEEILTRHRRSSAVNTTHVSISISHRQLNATALSGDLSSTNSDRERKNPSIGEEKANRNQAKMMTRHQLSNQMWLKPNRIAQAVDVHLLSWRRGYYYH